MPLTIKAILKPDERKTDRTHLVMLRLTKDRKRSHIGTGIYIPKKDWNPKGTLDKSNWIRTTNDLHELYNKELERLWKDAQTIELQQKPATLEELKRRLTGREEKASPSFLTYAREELARIERDSSTRTHEQYMHTVRRLEEYVGEGNDLHYSDLTLNWLKKYEQHLLKTKNRNTTSKYLSCLKTIVRRAVDEGKLPYTDNPFLNYKLKLEKSPKAKLTREEIKAIIELDLPAGTRIDQARTAFLLQFFMAGMRIGDLLQLRWEMVHNGRLDYQMEKTEKRKSIKLMPQVLELIEPYRKKSGYILPFLPEGLPLTLLQKKVESATTTINKALTTIAEKAGIEKKLSTHVARHSFASMAWGSTRDIKAVSEALGHGSLRITEAYLRELTHDEQDSLLSDTFGDF